MFIIVSSVIYVQRDDRAVRGDIAGDREDLSMKIFLT